MRQRGHERASFGGEGDWPMRVMAIALLMAGLAWPMAARVQPPARGTLRVHHLHLRAADPLAAMQAYAERFGGTRVVLPDVGAGVRLGNQYLLFAPQGLESPVARVDAVESALREALTWLTAHGMSLQDGTIGRLVLPGVGDRLAIDHIAFGAGDYPGAIAVLGTAGALPNKHTRASAMFDLGSGTRVEIVPGADAPETHWCPMHTDLRSSDAGTCPQCSMALVPIPPPRINEFRMDVGVVAGRQGRGLGGLHITIRDPDSGVPVSDFSVVHEQLLHLFIVGRDLDYFAHVHPERMGDGFRLAHDAPPGEYVTIADFLPKTGTLQMVHRAIVTPRFQAVPFGVVSLPAPHISGSMSRGSGQPHRNTADQTVDGVRIHLEAADLIAGLPALLRFSLSDATTGVRLTDLEPFLGAPGHMLLVNASLTDAVHGHPEEMDTRAPFVTFRPLMPAAGVCKLWVQFQRRGKVITAPFVIEVSES